MSSDSTARFSLKELSGLPDRKPTIKSILDEELTSAPAIADVLRVGRTVLKPWPVILGKGIEEPATLGCDFLHFTSAVFICNPGVLLMNLEHAPAAQLGEMLKASGYREVALTLARVRYVKIRYEKEGKSQTLKSGVFFVPVTMDDVRGVCIVDTGASRTVVTNKAIGKSFWEVRPTESRITDVKGNVRRGNEITLNRFAIGSFDLGEKVEVAYVEVKEEYLEEKHPQVPNGRVPVLGTIGMDTLTRANVVIDFGNRKLYLQR